MRPTMYTLSLSSRLHALRGRRLLIYVLAIGTVAMLLLCAYTLTMAGATQPLSDRYPGEPRYGIILDAGSTGSRVHVFEFRYRPGSSQPYVLVNELFQQIRPGLSAFARDPRLAAASLADLIEACKKRVPAHHWASTPLALKATAGLRLLKPETSARILAEVRRLLAQSPFALDKDAVSIMDGLDEGIFSWVTLNFLNGQLAKPEDSYGALDLGGGSTQVTFAASVADSAAAPAGFVKRLSLGGAKVRLYSHSYLGLGLMSARLAVLQSGGGGGRQLAPSPCLPSNYAGQWEQAGVAYNVSGVSVGGGAGGYGSCRALADGVVRLAGVHRPAGLSSARFYAFSYFYDRAADAGLIKPADGGEVTLARMTEAAKAACGDGGGDPRQPFLCLDLCYQVSLLAEGYGFAPEASFVMRKKIHNVELSWALGAVFDVFYNHAGTSGSATPPAADGAAAAAT